MKRAFLAIVAIVGAALLAGCSLLAPPPDFDVPVRWSGGRADGPDSTDPRMSLTLRADGIAELVNVPGGQWVQTDDGICWDETEEFYTGEGDWRAFNQQGVEVSFEDSTVIFWARPDKFFNPPVWSELKMVACGEEYKVWWLYLDCGTAGGESKAACPVDHRHKTGDS